MAKGVFGLYQEQRLQRWITHSESKTGNTFGKLTASKSRLFIFLSSIWSATLYAKNEPSHYNHCWGKWMSLSFEPGNLLQLMKPPHSVWVALTLPVQTFRRDHVHWSSIRFAVRATVSLSRRLKSFCHIVQAALWQRAAALDCVRPRCFWVNWVS